MLIYHLLWYWLKRIYYTLWQSLIPIYNPMCDWLKLTYPSMRYSLMMIYHDNFAATTMVLNYTSISSIASIVATALGTLVCSLRCCLSSPPLLFFAETDCNSATVCTAATDCNAAPPSAPPSPTSFLHPCNGHHWNKKKTYWFPGFQWSRFLFCQMASMVCTVFSFLNTNIELNYQITIDYAFERRSRIFVFKWMDSW